MKAADRNGWIFPKAITACHCKLIKVIKETIKRAEDGNGIVIRMYESENAYTKAKLTVRRPFAQAQICNLLEEAESAASGSENVIAVTLKPLEVVTVKVF